MTILKKEIQTHERFKRTLFIRTKRKGFKERYLSGQREKVLKNAIYQDKEKRFKRTLFIRTKRKGSKERYLLGQREKVQKNAIY